MINKLKAIFAAPGEKKQAAINARYKELIDSMIIDRDLKVHLGSDKYENYNFTAMMGISKNKSRIIDLIDTPNFIVVDRENDRHTDVIRTMAATLAMKNYPEDLMLYVIDTKGKYKELKELPHTRFYASDDESVAGITDVMINEVNRRYTLMQHFHNVSAERIGVKRMLFVFDDISSIYELGLDEEHIEKLADVLSIGHKLGIHCILGTTRDITDVIDDEMISQYKVRVLFTAKDIEESKAVLKKGGAESLGHNEAAMVFRIPHRTGRDDDEPEENFRLKPYHMTNQQIEHIIDTWKNM